ncbi:MAG: eNDOG [Chlamydiales bacterium]|jgi:endonuclease G|nr:eNDOG [Chlamydiales bacterium]
MKFKTLQSLFFAGAVFFAGAALGLALSLLVHSQGYSDYQADIARSQEPLFSQMAISKSGYQVVYDNRLRIASCVYERLTADSVQGTAKRRQMTFREDLAVEEPFRVGLKDFIGSGFDRGHLAPAADYKNSLAEMADTFALSNVVPQDPKMNRGIWAHLERQVRDLTGNYQAVHVFTGPLFIPESDKDGKRFVKYEVISQKNVAVPSHLYKVIFCETSLGKIDEFAYIIPNQPIDPKLRIAKFQVSVDQVESIAGVIFKKWKR